MEHRAYVAARDWARVQEAAVKHYNYVPEQEATLVHRLEVRGWPLFYYDEQTDQMREATHHPVYGLHYDVVIVSKHLVRNGIRVVGPVPDTGEVPKESIHVVEGLFVSKFLSSTIECQAISKEESF